MERYFESPLAIAAHDFNPKINFKHLKSYGEIGLSLLEIVHCLHSKLHIRMRNCESIFSLVAHDFAVAFQTSITLHFGIRHMLWRCEDNK